MTNNIIKIQFDTEKGTWTSVVYETKVSENNKQYCHLYNQNDNQVSIYLSNLYKFHVDNGRELVLYTYAWESDNLDSIKNRLMTQFKDYLDNQIKHHLKNSDAYLMLKNQYFT